MTESQESGKNKFPFKEVHETSPQEPLTRKEISEKVKIARQIEELQLIKENFDAVIENQIRLYKQSLGQTLSQEKNKPPKKITSEEAFCSPYIHTVVLTSQEACTTLFRNLLKKCIPEICLRDGTKYLDFVPDVIDDEEEDTVVFGWYSLMIDEKWRVAPGEEGEEIVLEEIKEMIVGDTKYSTMF